MTTIQIIFAMILVLIGGLSAGFLVGYFRRPKPKQKSLERNAYPFGGDLKKQCYTYVSDLSVREGLTSWVSNVHADIKFIGAFAYDLPDGGDIVLDVNKNGTTIFRNQHNRLIISPECRRVIRVPDETEINIGDRIAVDVDQVGRIYPGGNVEITIYYKER